MTIKLRAFTRKPSQRTSTAQARSDDSSLLRLEPRFIQIEKLLISTGNQPDKVTGFLAAIELGFNDVVPAG